jgi:hypothetical protein
MFKKILAVFLFMSSSFALAETVPSSSKVAVGLGVGSNDGISVLYNYAPDEALQGFLSIGKGFSHGSLDYIRQFPEAFGSGVVVPYVGVGGFNRHAELKGEDSTNYGFRVPFGLNVNVPETPVKFEIEVAPTLAVYPENDSYMDSMMAVRLRM